MTSILISETMAYDLFELLQKSCFQVTIINIYFKYLIEQAAFWIIMY